MKSAEQRAVEVAGYGGLEDDAQVVAEIERSFKEHARDQRHIIAELQAANSSADRISRCDAYSIAMNAHAPGEST